ncbi:MAG TPA: BON domain-containing protein [Solirubrobacteraceae bacterium]
MTARPDGRDRSLEVAARARLDRDPDALVRALARYEVTVLGGRARLTGHVRSRQVARRMADLAGQVRGLDAVEDCLVADDELVILVASAIGGSARNRASRLVVRSEFGHVRIGGVYPSPEAHAEAMRIGAGIPGVLDATPGRASDLLG